MLRFSLSDVNMVSYLYKIAKKKRRNANGWGKPYSLTFFSSLLKSPLDGSKMPILSFIDALSK
jgi:hypothetical protein